MEADGQFEWDDWDKVLNQLADRLPHFEHIGERALSAMVAESEELWRMLGGR